MMVRFSDRPILRIRPDRDPTRNSAARDPSFDRGAEVTAHFTAPPTAVCGGRPAAAEAVAEATGAAPEPDSTAREADLFDSCLTRCRARFDWLGPPRSNVC